MGMLLKYITVLTFYLIISTFIWIMSLVIVIWFSDYPMLSTWPWTSCNIGSYDWLRVEPWRRTWLWWPACARCTSRATWRPCRACRTRCWPACTGRRTPARAAAPSTASPGPGYQAPWTVRMKLTHKLWESDKDESVELNIVAGCRAVSCVGVAACSAASPIIIRGASHLVTTRGAKHPVM